MAEGTVSTYDAETGWGVIAPDDGGPHPRVHQTEIRTHGDQALERGERVSFVLKRHDDDWYATAVTPLGPILSEEELVDWGIAPEPGSPESAPSAAAPPQQGALLPGWMLAVIVVIALAALPCFVIGLILVANGHEEWLPLLIGGIVMLLVLKWIPRDAW